MDAEEGQFPDLKQSAARKAAHAVMYERIKDLRDRGGMSLVAKGSIKERVQEDYKRILREQAQARFEAARKRKG